MTRPSRRAVAPARRRRQVSEPTPTARRESTTTSDAWEESIADARRDFPSESERQRVTEDQLQHEHRQLRPDERFTRGLDDIFLRHASYILSPSLFILGVFAYWLIYDKASHAFISDVYMEDKYGVVMLYFVASTLSAFKTVLTWLLACQRLRIRSLYWMLFAEDLRAFRERNPDVPKSEYNDPSLGLRQLYFYFNRMHSRLIILTPSHLAEDTMIDEEVNHIGIGWHKLVSQVMLQFFKAFCFTLIFKNNTSPLNTMWQQAHLVAVILFAVPCLLSFWITGGCQFGWAFWMRIAWGALCAFLYLVFGTLATAGADSFSVVSYWSDHVFLKFCTVLFGSLATTCTLVW